MNQKRNKGNKSWKSEVLVQDKHNYIYLQVRRHWDFYIDFLSKSIHSSYFGNHRAMESPPMFNSVEDECRYWKERAKLYHKE